MNAESGGKTDWFFNQRQLSQTDMYHFSNNWSLNWRTGAFLQKLSNIYTLATKIQWGTDPAILILC
jgi:hypothetical protein